MTNWDAIRRSLTPGTVDARVAEARRKDRADAEMLAFQSGASLCATCARVAGFGAETCWRCAGYEKARRA
jgi:hypothetical protein